MLFKCCELQSNSEINNVYISSYANKVRWVKETFVNILY